MTDQDFMLRGNAAVMVNYICQTAGANKGPEGT